MCTRQWYDQLQHLMQLNKIPRLIPLAINHKNKSTFSPRLYQSAASPTLHVRTIDIFMRLSKKNENYIIIKLFQTCYADILFKWHFKYSR